ncbi:3'-5' RNA nuclease TATDN2-like isoform X2 [Tachypleus tridentatus]|uniref:3'-5' RNA nuclease TATDN2-like isoform X2 n=2 Tax=Tachypleus tridentatus TaxID=6853 RepID=UPI003FD40B8E
MNKKYQGSMTIRRERRKIYLLLLEVPYDHFIHRHCFTGNWNKACMWLNTFPNLYLGLTPLVTDPLAVDIHEVARKTPLVLETDAPYFIPRLICYCMPAFHITCSEDITRWEQLIMKNSFDIATAKQGLWIILRCKGHPEKTCNKLYYKMGILWGSPGKFSKIWMI